MFPEFPTRPMGTVEETRSPGWTRTLPFWRWARSTQNPRHWSNTLFPAGCAASAVPGGLSGRPSFASATVPLHGAYTTSPKIS